MAVNFSLDDLKRPRWFYNIGNNTIALNYKINGQDHVFLPEDYISKGFRKGDVQRFNVNLLKNNALESIFTEGALVDLEGLAPNWALNSLEKTGLGSKGVIVPVSTLQNTGVMDNRGLITGNKKYTINESDRTKGELLGLTKLDDRYVYLQQPQGSRAGLTYVDETGDTRAEFIKVRGGWLGEQVVNIAENFAEVPLLPEVIGAITGSPALYASLKGFQTAGSGGDLKDVFESGVKAYVGAGGLRGTPNLSTEAVTALETMTAVSGEEDPLQAFITQYGANQLGEVLEGSDFANYAKSSLTDVVGADTVNFLEDNIDYVKAGKDILIEGKDPSEVLANRFGERIVSGLGAESPTERALAFAGLKTGVALDQGKSDQEALFAGAKEYFDRGGELPDVNQIANIAGIDAGDFKFDLGDFGINVPDLPLDFDLRGLAGRGFDLSNIPFPELEARGFSLPEIKDLGIDISGLQFPDLQARGFGLGDIGDLGFDIGSMDFSGFRPGDLGDYSLPELKNMGVNIGDLNLDLELGGLGVALAGAEQQQREQLAEEEELLDGTAQFQPEFSEIEGPSFAREVLGRRFT